MRTPRLLLTAGLAVLSLALATSGEGTARAFECAGAPGAAGRPVRPVGTPKPALGPAQTTTGTASALVLFARFGDETGGPVPAWGSDLLNPAVRGSVSHFYDEMSRGQYRLRGTVMERWYSAAGPSSSYLAANPSQHGGYGRLSREVIRQVDGEVDFGRFDNDGPDGIPNSGDDDGLVDMVFVVLASTPANLILGGATGVGDLGWDTSMDTGDRAAVGGMIRISPLRGTVQRGRTFAEASGAMCHEYGHVLGLPDLYNTAYLQGGGSGPADDSAGIGAWGLMGWGAAGWTGSDGPNPFCAWSRMQLGWASVRRATAEVEEVTLAAVGTTAEVMEVPIGSRESFLLEYRRRDASFYERHLPGEGLLIWHSGIRPGEVSHHLDLECADGRWVEAGYPLGSTPAPEGGGDNLDFWAHDETYAAAHGGNLGDVGDPYGSASQGRFTPQSNPSSLSFDRERGISVSDVRIAGDRLVATVQSVPTQVRIASFDMVDGNGDGVLGAGEEAELQVRLVNDGGLDAQEIRIVTTSPDAALEVLATEVAIPQLAAGGMTGRPPPPGDYPRIRLSPSFDGQAEVGARVQIVVAGEVVDERAVTIPAVSAHQLIVEVVGDDGAPRPGISLSLQNTEGEMSVYRGQTGADGRDTLSLPPNSYLIFVQPRLAFTVDLQSDQTVRYVIPDPVTLSGVVYGLEGVPLDGASINTMFESARTGEDGSYSLQLAPGRHAVTVRRDSRDLATAYGVQTFWGEAPSDRFDMTLVQGASVRVEPTFTDDGEDAGGDVNLSGQSSASVRAKKLADGTRGLRLLPGVYTLIYRGSAYSAGYATERFYPVEILGDTTLRMQVQRQIKLSARVLDATGQPLRRVVLSLLPLAGSTHQEIRIWEGELARLHLPAGEYHVLYAGDDEGTPAQHVGRFSLAGEAERTFVLSDGLEVRGRVVGLESLPPGDLFVHATSRQAEAGGSVAVGQDGEFALALPRGRYSFMVELDGREYWQIASADVPVVGELVLAVPDGVPIRGVVEDALGAPANRALVYATAGPGSQGALTGYYGSHWRPEFSPGLVAAAMTDETGQYTLRGVRPGSIVCALPYRGGGVGMTWASAAVPPVLRLPAAHTIHGLYGTINYPPGAVRYSVLLQFRDQSTGVVVQGRSHWQSNSYYLAVPAGQYEVWAATVSPAGGVQDHYRVGSVAVREGRRWDIDLGEAQTAVTEAGEVAVPRRPTLEQNYPNPFNATTVIRFSVPGGGKVRLTVYNVLGQPVRILVDELIGSGSREVRWDGRGDDGRAVSSGVYVCRLATSEQVVHRRIAVLK